MLWDDLVESAPWFLKNLGRLHENHNGISRKGAKTQSVGILNSSLFLCALATLRETFLFLAPSARKPLIRVMN
jgi:hypothetical protein